MPINSAVANAVNQTNFDKTNATNDVKEINYIKQQVALAPDHKVTQDQATKLRQALDNLQVNQSKITTDLRNLQAGGHTAEVGQTADYMNALNNSARQGVSDLESNNDLDDALTANGSSSGDVHTLLDQINTANAGNLNYANQVAPNSDAHYQDTVDLANQLSQPAGDPSAAEPITVNNAANPDNGESTVVQTSSAFGTAQTIATDLKSGNQDQALQDLKNGYANYLAGTQQTDSPAIRQLFGEQVKSAGAGLLNGDQQGTLGQVVDGWSGHQA